MYAGYIVETAPTRRLFRVAAPPVHRRRCCARRRASTARSSSSGRSRARRPTRRARSSAARSRRAARAGCRSATTVMPPLAPIARSERGPERRAALRGVPQPDRRPAHDASVVQQGVAPAPEPAPTLLETRDLSVYFASRAAACSVAAGAGVRAVDRVSTRGGRGTGRSGWSASRARASRRLGRAIVRLLRPRSGSILLDGAGHRTARGSRACGRSGAASRWSSRTPLRRSTQRSASARASSSRSSCSTGRRRPSGGSAGRRAARPGRAAAVGSRAVPARAERRPAPARRDRPGARAPPRARRRGRAGERAGRLDPGPDPRPPARPAAAARTRRSCSSPTTSP